MSSITDSLTKATFVNENISTEVDLVKVNLNGTTYYKYVKAYTYNKNVTYTRPGYSWDFTCYRSSSPYKGASTGPISDGGTIYYGDVIYFAVNSDLQNVGITLTTTKPQSYPLTVTGNVNASDYISVNKAIGKVWLIGYGEDDPNAITTMYARVDNGSWVQYNNVSYDDISVMVQGNVYFDSAIDIYDVPNTGYTARYTQSSPLRINLERDYQSINNEGEYIYYYQAQPATCAYQFVKNTGINKIYYRNGTSGNWTELSSTTTVYFNYNSTVQWYATAATGYSRNDSYTSSSNYQTFTVTAKKTISPAATRLTYGFTVTLGDYVTAYQVSTDNSTWTTYNATHTFSGIDYDTTYYVRPSSYGVSDSQYTYTWSSGSASTITRTYSNHADITYSMTRTLASHTYGITIAFFTTDLIDPYYICDNYEEYQQMISPGGIGYMLVIQDSINKTTSGNTVTLTNTEINNICVPEGYYYPNGSITINVDPSEDYYYVGVYVEAET